MATPPNIAVSPRGPLLAFRERLRLNRFVVLDGGLATECEAHGINLNHAALWSTKALLDSPEIVRRVHEDYINAGAEIIETCSYQTTPGGCAELGVDLYDVVRMSVEVARDAVARTTRSQSSTASTSAFPVLVGGSIGSIGASITGGHEYTGAFDVDVTRVRTFHETRLRALLGLPPPRTSTTLCDDTNADNDASPATRRPLSSSPLSRVDVLLLETFPRLDEALLLLPLIKELFDEAGVVLPVTLGFTVGCDGVSLPDGTSFVDAFSQLLQHDAPWSDFVVALGCNCCAPEVVPAVFSQLWEAKRHSHQDARQEVAAICYPNSGEIFLAASGSWMRPGEGEANAESSKLLSSPQSDLAKNWRMWLENAEVSPQGETFVGGGCCRTGPADVAALRALVAERQKGKGDRRTEQPPLAE